MDKAGDIIHIGAGGHFQLEEIISKATYGKVWAAQWVEVKQPVAVKMVRDDLMAEADDEQRRHWPASLQREIEFLRTVRAHHIVRLLREGTHRGCPVFVMEQLDMSLRMRITPDELPPTPVPLPIAAAWVRQIVDGLDTLHGRRLRHLDLKPDNILLTPDGILGRTIRLADFGEILPSDEARHRLRGTPGWQAPEQFWPCERNPDGFLYQTDHRADIYVLGLLLFYLLTGEKTTFALRATALHRQNPELSAWLAPNRDISAFTDDDQQRFMQSVAGAPGNQQERALQLLLRLLAPDPAHRPQDANEVIALLKGLR